MMPELVDSHCHLDFACFDDDRTALLAAAKQQGVGAIVVPGVTASGWPALQRLCQQHSALFPAFGLHPCFLDQHRQEDLHLLSELVSQAPVVAIGEIGLDLFDPQADLAAQLSFLIPQLELAKQRQLPVILHVRKAHDQMLQQLRRLQLARGGIVHAFSGSLQQAEQYLQLGFRLGLGGGITYLRANRLRKLVQTLPLGSFVLETDAPDMPLAGYQGQRNEPSRVRLVAEALAGLKQCSLAEVAEVTTMTARQVLKLAV
ncbi:TatD family hydrolase [Pontibacter sp. JAM-7]|uniref:TatD family hydrolase n=1 Tax=Pontibacter sp. JAM-7 TaxID=3366581 RepID=UPI003AF6D77C